MKLLIGISVMLIGAILGIIINYFTKQLLIGSLISFLIGITAGSIIGLWIIEK